MSIARLSTAIIYFAAFIGVAAISFGVIYPNSVTAIAGTVLVLGCLTGYMVSETRQSPRPQPKELRPAAYALMTQEGQEAAASRAEVAVEFAEWNMLIEETVDLLKGLIAIDGGNREELDKLGMHAAYLRSALLTEKKRIRALKLAFSDAADSARHDRVMQAGRALLAQLRQAARDTHGYRAARRAHPPEKPAVEPKALRWQRRDQLLIRYTGADGKGSDRVITPVQLLRQGPVVHLGAHCQMRNAYRDFRADRIDQLIDMSTGEIVKPSGVADWLMQRAGAMPLPA